MTFAAVGSSIQVSASTFSLTPSATGNFILCEIVCGSGGDYATALSSSNVTWSVLVGHTSCPADSLYATVFIGKVTSTGTATVTISVNAGSPAFNGQVHEFSTTAGYSAVTLDASAVTGATATTAYPSVTPGHGSGELYYCYAYNDATATVGSTSGYTYDKDGNGNGSCWNPSCTSSAQAPVWGDSNKRDGVAVLLYEAVTVSPTKLLMASSL